jgi:hypothetical protein
LESSNKQVLSALESYLGSGKGFEEICLVLNTTTTLETVGLWCDSQQMQQIYEELFNMHSEYDDPSFDRYLWTKFMSTLAHFLRDTRFHYFVYNQLDSIENAAFLLPEVNFLSCPELREQFVEKILSFASDESKKEIFSQANNPWLLAVFQVLNTFVFEVDATDIYPRLPSILSLFDKITPEHNLAFRKPLSSLLM